MHRRFSLPRNAADVDHPCFNTSNKKCEFGQETLPPPGYRRSRADTTRRFMTPGLRFGRKSLLARPATLRRARLRPFALSEKWNSSAPGSLQRFREVVTITGF